MDRAGWSLMLRIQTMAVNVDATGDLFCRIPFPPSILPPLAYPDRLLYDVDVLEVELHVPILCGYAILGVRQLSDSIGT